MSVTVQSLINQVSVDLLEPAPAQFATGLVTTQEVLDLIGEVAMDYLRQSALDLEIFTQRIVSGTAQYLYPNFMTDVYYVFLDGKILEPTNLNSEHLANPPRPGNPRVWHADGLPLKTIELVPTPNFTGAAITPTFTGPPAGIFQDFQPGSRNLTFVGPRLASTASWRAGDTFDTVPDSLTPYIVYGVLARIFAADGETRDDIRAPYAEARYGEGVSLAKSFLQSALSLGRPEEYI